jgi:chromosome segregation protein
MKRVLTWRQLDLSGFGHWKGTTRFRFPDGLGVLCLPNERGKSTMVAGLQAVLFGLSSETDPGGSGIGRYRSWSRPEVCRGRLDLEIDGRIVRIRREMVTHKTIVDEIDASAQSLKVLFDGVANPGARAAGQQSYRSFLDDLLGDLADQKLFASTFVIEQPVLPASEMSESLRQLVGGIGRVGGQQAQKILFDTVKSLTRATGDLGILSPNSERPTNQRTDGRIEETEALIRGLEAQRDGAEQQFERKDALETALQRSTEGATRLREDEKHARADLEQIEAFRKDRGEAESARQAYEDLKRVLDEHDGRLAGALKAQERIAGDYGDLVGAPEDLEARIDAVLKLEESRRTLVAAAASPITGPAGARTEEEHRTRLDAEHRSGRETLARLDRWARVPTAEGQSRPEPVVWLARFRAVAERFQAAVARFLEIDGQHHEARTQRERFGAIAVLPEAAQEELTRLDAVREERQNTEQLAATLREEVEARRREFDERYASLDGFDLPRFLSILEGRATQHRRLREMDEEAKDLYAVLATLPAGRRWLRGLLIGVPAGALAALVPLYFQLHPAFAAGAFLLLAGLSLLLFTTPSARVRATRTRLRESEKEIDSVRERLRGEFIPSGPWLPDDEFAYERARTLISNHDSDLEAIRRTERTVRRAEGASGEDLPPLSGEEIEETEFEVEEGTPGSLAARIAALDRLERKAKEIAEACGMPAPDAVREYRKLSARLHAIAQQREDTLKEITGAETAREFSRPEPVREAQEREAGDGPLAVEDPLSVQVGALPSDWDLLKQADLLMDLRTGTLREINGALSSMGTRQWAEWEEEAREFCATRDRVVKIEESIDAIASIQRSLDEARGALGETPLAASGGDVRRLRERLRERDALAREIKTAERSALDLLRAAPGKSFEDRDSIQKALFLADERRRDAQARIDRAIEGSDLIGGYDRAPGVEQDRIRRDVTDKAKTLAASLQRAELDLAQAQAELNAWRSESPVSLAGLEIEIAQRREELETLRERADAASKAWHLLGEAIEVFRATHQVELGEGLDRFFKRITHRESRKLALDPKLEIGILEDGHASSEGQLSQGAKDQLAFCLRLTVAELVAGELVLPLILDDPFVHSDAERLQRIMEALEETSRDRQIILLTQDERLTSRGQPVRVEAL